MNKEILEKIRQDEFIFGACLGSLVTTLLLSGIVSFAALPIGILVMGGFFAGGYMKYGKTKEQETQEVKVAQAEPQPKSVSTSEENK